MDTSDTEGPPTRGEQHDALALFLGRWRAEGTSQSYLQNIKAKTGKGPEDFRRLAAEKGFTNGDTLKDGVKAGDIVAWLKQDFDLGHGHAMAIYALLKGSKSEDSE